jgi:leucyl aminopeptidase
VSDLSRLLAHQTPEQSVITIELVSANNYENGLSESETAWAAVNGFSGKKDTLCPLPSAKGGMDRILMGMGNAEAITSDPQSHNPWWLAEIASKLEAGHYRITGASAEKLAAGALGWCLEQYKFDRYLGDTDSKDRVLILDTATDIPSLVHAITGMALTRDLINTPTEHMGPADLQDAAEALAETYGGQCSTIVGDDLLDENFPAIHAVGRAAAEGREPRLIDLQWGDENHPKITLVGKGVCFDTGGLDIKPAAGMLLMKKDMGGAAHVLGLARMIMGHGLPVRLRVLIPAVENAISGNAYRPGDVIATRKGLSVEIGNTDAEGRLVLCDALALASEEDPALILDFATLTGAARTALGPDLPATFVNDDALWQALEDSGRTVGDPLWRMPLWAPYDDLLKSDIADMNNIASSGLGGAITAALYLQRFVGEGIQWAHFDVFGWAPSAQAGRSKGGAAQALRAALRTIEKIVAS